MYHVETWPSLAMAGDTSGELHQRAYNHALSGWKQQDPCDLQKPRKGWDS
jgi:hypothetical protein